MKVRKVKQMLIAALVACAGILVSNAAAVASDEKEFALLPPVMLTGLSATPITNGQTLADSTISGTATAVDFGDVVGTFAWDAPTTAPQMSDSQTTAYAVTFTPTDPNHSKTGATTLTLTVEINERQKAIEETFPAPTYAVTGPDEEGVYTVTLQDDVTGPVRIPDNLGKVQIDLNGHTITGPNGETGGATETGTSGQSAIIVYHDTEKSGDATELAIVDGDGGDGNTPGDGAPAIKIDDGVQTGVTLVVGEQVDIQGGKGGNALGVDADGNGVPGGDGDDKGGQGGEGTAAIVVSNAAAQVSVVGPGSVTGGNGGAGNPPGEGGAAIADADGGTIAPASVTGGAKVAPGKSVYVAAAVEIVRVVTSHPWGGILNVEYVCARLRRGYAYKVSFFVTVDGEDKCWTVTLPTQDVSLESFRNTAVLRLDEKFGAGKRDPRAKIFATIDPIAVAE